jgi:COMM domain containing 9
MLIRRCVYENTCKDDYPKLFPDEVLPELQKLLTLLLQKFQQQWQEDVLKDQVWSGFTADFVCELNYWIL